MLWRSVIKTAAKYTDDNIVLGLILKWVLAVHVFSFLGFSIERKFEINVDKHEDENQIRIDFHISCGWFIFKREFNISDIKKKKRYEPDNKKIVNFQQEVTRRLPVVYIENNKQEKERGEQSDIEKEFYAWKKRVLAKKFGVDIA